VRRFIVLGAACVLAITALSAQEKPVDTPKAAISRKKLKEKISYECTDLALRDVLPELTEKIGVPLRIEPKGGVSGNLKITYKGDNQPLEKVLGEMFKKNGLGFYVFSKEKHADDGAIWITNRPSERGYRVGDEMEANNKDKSDTKTAKKDKSKNKSKDKDDVEAKEKKPAKEPTEKTDDDPDKMEKDAARKLSFAKILLSDGKTDKAKTWLNDIVTKFPSTKAADEAKELLKKLDK
jgi:hypothetical protein